MIDSYSLGSGVEEQERLFLQREIYGDTVGLQFSPSETVVEFGCGAGANLWIAQDVIEGKYIGIDNQTSQLNKALSAAKALNLKNVEFLNRNADDTNLNDNSADVCFCRCVLIHQPDPLPILKEMCRVAKPGARLIVIEPWDPTYYVGPDKPNLLKCFHARTFEAYGEGRGSPDVAVNLNSLFLRFPVESFEVKPHVIYVSGSEGERCRKFLQNLLGLTDSLAPQLIEKGLVSAEEWELAQFEAQTVTRETFLTQTLWIAEVIII